MSKFKVLLSRKQYVELIVKAKDKKHAIKKAYNDEYEKVIDDEYLFPSSKYIVEDVIKIKGRKIKKLK